MPKHLCVIMRNERIDLFMGGNAIGTNSSLDKIRLVRRKYMLEFSDLSGETAARSQ